MLSRLINLHKWALSKGLTEAADAILKLSAGNPLPINRALVEDVVDELLEVFMAKMLAYGISPLAMISFVAGQVVMPEDMASVLATTTSRTQEDVTGQELDIEYQLLFSSNPNLPQGQAGGILGESKRTVVLGVNPSPGLQESVGKVLDSYPSIRGPEAWNSAFSLPQQLSIFKEMLRGHLIETLRHEEVHARDVLYPRSRQGEVYTIENSEGESLSDISRKKQVDLRSLFVNNLTHLATHPSLSMTLDIIDVIRNLSQGGQREDLERQMDAMFVSLKDVKLQAGIEIFIPARGESQVLAKNGETLRQAAERLQVDPIRLLVINYNNLFGKLGAPYAHTYQSIYDIPSANTNMLLDTPILSDDEIRIIPNYSELYSYDRGFYLLTREESKAHYEQIIYQLEQATSGMSKADISSITFKDMLQMSVLIKDYIEVFKKNPVDEIVKTPIYGKTIARLKDERYQDFINRMYTHWTNNFRDITKEEGG